MAVSPNTDWIHDEREPGTEMDEDDLKAVLGRKIEEAMGAEDGELSEVRAAMLASYRGDKQGDERPGHSQTVSRDVAEVVEWTLADLLEVFASNERVVEFRASNPEDVLQARRESDVANFYWKKEFMTTYNWAKKTLLYPVAYCYFGWRRRNRIRTYELEGVPEQQLYTLMQDPKVEIIGQEETVQYTELGPVPAFRLKIREKCLDSKPHIETYPSNQVLISPSATTLDMDELPFSGIWEMCTISELMEEEDLDQEAVAMLEEERGDYDREALSNERSTLRDYEDESPHTIEEPADDTVKQIQVYRISMLIDVDGDGLAERRSIVYAGGEILYNEPDDYQPLVAMSALPIPDKHIGMSLTEMVMDLQKIKTMLFRQIHDNLINLNTRRKYVNQQQMVNDGSTLRALKNAKSEVVPVKGDPRSAVVHEEPSEVAPMIMPYVQYVDERKKTQTGVAPDLHMDPAMLQRVAAEPMLQQQSAANKRVKMMVRVMSETGFAKGLGKLHYLLRTHQNHEVHVELHDGMWLSEDPKTWRERNDVKVNVGLGFTNKERRLASLQQLLATQLEQVGPMNMAPPDRIFATLRKYVEVLDIGDVSQYFVDPQSPEYQPPQPPPPDPMMMAQIEALQVNNQKLMQEEQRRMMEAQMNHQRDMAKLNLEREKAGIDGKVRLEEITLKQWASEREHSHADRKNLAEVRNKEADTELKLTQADKLEKEPAKPESD